MRDQTHRGLGCYGPERHMWESGLALAIHMKIGALTWKPETETYGTYTTSVEAMADFFGSHYSSTWRAFKWLTKNGWLRQMPTSRAQAKLDEGEITAATLTSMKKGQFKSKDYQYIHHSEWQKTHPGQCDTQIEAPWSSDIHDLLGQQLYKSSDSLKWYAGQLKCLRKAGISDKGIIASWEKFEDDKPRPVGKVEWKTKQGRFLKAAKNKILREVAA